VRVPDEERPEVVGWGLRSSRRLTLQKERLTTIICNINSEIRAAWGTFDGVDLCVACLSCLCGRVNV
jgi:hypothetical protein